MFIGRTNELNFLEDKYRASGGQLVVLYGRRRIGKTEILRKFCEGKEHVFYSCTKFILDRKALCRKASEKKDHEKITEAVKSPFIRMSVRLF